MNINLTLLAQAATFAIFIWFTARFVWPYLSRAIDDRQKHIAEGLAAAERGKQDLVYTEHKDLMAENLEQEGRPIKRCGPIHGVEVAVGNLAI